MSIVPFDYEPRRAQKVKRYPIIPGKPPVAVISAMNSGVTKPTRRIEIYEADATTRWVDDHDCLKSGSVGIDQNSSERRKTDLVLANKDNKLRPNPNGGLWYDKIIKVFTGIEFSGASVSPRSILIGAPDAGEASRIQSWLGTAGLQNVEVNLGATIETDLSEYDFIVEAYDEFVKVDVLKRWWAAGKNILTLGVDESMMLNGIMIDGYEGVTGDPMGISQPSHDTPLLGSFGDQEIAPYSGNVIDGLMPGVRPIAVWPATGPFRRNTVIIGTSAASGDWLHLNLAEYRYNEVRLLVKAGVDYMRDANYTHIWETQVGEFMIDSIGITNHPDEVKVTCRDYWKKLINEKTRQTMAFDAGTSVRQLVRALAINAGIDPLKIIDSIGSESLVSQLAYDKGTEYGAIIKAVCDIYNYDVFFDAFGRLIIRAFTDPSTSPIYWTFKEGKDGNLVNHDRSVNDGRIYNHVIVTSAPAEGEDVLPYFGEAINEDPTSPTNIKLIGRRVLPVQINGLASDAACRDLAESRLKITALESYEVNFGSIRYPWFNTGETVEILDPKALDFEPARYLMDTLSIPLELGIITGTAKRVTFVGNSGNPDTIPQEG